MSNDAYRQIRGKVEIVCDDMGPQPLKNIAEPMQAWRVLLTGQIHSAIKPKGPPRGVMLKETGREFLSSDVWKMHVTDEAGATVCRLRFSAEDCD
jgi:hypothetical protein